MLGGEMVIQKRRFRRQQKTKGETDSPEQSG